MNDRSAVDTIAGYFYQFDHSILSLMTLVDELDTVALECIEDIDVYTATDTTAIQCKFYAQTEYNHSVIKPARDAEIQELKASLKAGEAAREFAVTKAVGDLERERDAVANELKLSVATRSVPLSMPSTNAPRGMKPSVPESLR